jgi:hypothetical protein
MANLMAIAYYVGVSLAVVTVAVFTAVRALGWIARSRAAISADTKVSSINARPTLHFEIMVHFKL